MEAILNRQEQQILSDLIKAVRKSKPQAWSQLKREVLDHGYQDHYPIQGQFLAPAKIALSALPYEQQSELRECLFIRRPAMKHMPPEEAVEYYARELVEYYASLVVGEVVRRARIAADRTSEW